MSVRINANSCKNALGTVFLLATAFFVCSTFISMRSVFADPIAPDNSNVVQSGRQSPRSTSRTSNRTISRSSVSRATSGATITPTRSAVSRGTAGSRSVSSRSITPTRKNANVVSRGVATRGQSTRGTGENRSVRARTATSATRVAATGNVIAAGSDRASVNTTYSYLNSRLYTGNYSNIIDSTTGLISADAYSNCMDSYYACMDEICTARSTTKGRCSCAGRAKNFLTAEDALQRANEELITLSGQLSLLIATKGKGDDIAAAFSLTDAEKVMNCVSWSDIYATAKDNTQDSKGNVLTRAQVLDNWCKDHSLYNYESSACSFSVTSATGPSYCSESGNNFNFDISKVDGSSSDILAQLKAWAETKDLAKQYTKEDNSQLSVKYTSLSSYVYGLVGGSVIGADTEEAALDKLANKWGYELYEYAHNNVCGRVLDSCFNGIYEACGTPPTVTESDGETKHTKCMNGATTSCPFNYNSYIGVNANGDVELNERGSNSNATDKTSAACFGYTTNSTTTGTRTTTTTNDPYYNLRGPVADARRSIMQKYLLDSNAACDAYGEALVNTAQNINYQKVAAQQALQQKRLEFKQQEDAAQESNYATYADNLATCLDELRECYSDYEDEDWTNARLKTYCAQKSQIPHCYEPMVCAPAGGQIVAVIDKPDNTKCTWHEDYHKNTCRNVVTINEILYGASKLDPNFVNSLGDDYPYIANGKDINSAMLREYCLQERTGCKEGSLKEECLRTWEKSMTYSIRYFDGNKELTDVAPATYSTGQLPLSFSPVAPEKDGSTFKGWCYKPDFSDEGGCKMIIKLEETAKGVKIFYAKYE